ncbi:hypothetical protein KZ483_25700 [Paenibacillus sp. sptzw28]|uniref:hypothetical protein n=1 Tax=Paenibacillus sp. sptzw28 TaxID=715179 RepID=UPI001C6E41F0|nr:hypothetical protein [Paenibacillus sp. sptzw28]QYR21073.1 hypothetical protein KZ483_25700 [Paenibacillus sp. sptzw28]
MRYTVQYIPLSKIKPDLSARITQRVKELRKAAHDCMNLLIVRKSRKARGYVIVSGINHFKYLKNHTNKKYAPCLIDESKALSNLASLIHRFRKRKLPYEVPYIKPDRLAGGSWSIINSFLKQEPRFKRLSRSQQIKVLRLGFQYKRTTISSMKAKVNDLLAK